jgi:hypothetical protein
VLARLHKLVAAVSVIRGLGLVGVLAGDLPAFALS